MTSVLLKYIFLNIVQFTFRKKKITGSFISKRYKPQINIPNRNGLWPFSLWDLVQVQHERESTEDLSSE